MGEVAPNATDLILNRARVACVFPGGAEAEEFTSLSRTDLNPVACDTSWDREVKALKPQRVLMLNWTSGGIRYRYGGRWLEQCDREYQQRYRATLTTAVRRFQSSGAEVVLANSPYGQYQWVDTYAPPGSASIA